MNTNQEYDELRNEVKKMQKEDFPTANIIIAGITGSGKSTLINAVFGENLAETGTGSAVTQNIATYSKDNVPVKIWDTVGLELNQKVTETTIENVRNIISDKAKNKTDKLDRIHAIWYCIQATGHRFQDAEMDFIYKLKNLGVPFIVVITKCMSKKKDIEFEKKVNEMLISKNLDVPVIRVLSQNWEIEIDDEIRQIESFGVDKLVNLTAELLPEFICESFIASQKVDKELKRGEAEKVIIKHCEDVREKIRYKLPIINIFSSNDKIKKMFKEIGILYNVALNDIQIESVYNVSIGEWKGKLNVLLNPFPSVTMEKADLFFKKNVINQPGFDNNSFEFTDWEKAAKLVTWAGYSWIIAIEKYWDELINADKDELEDIIKNMVKELKNYMRQEKQSQSN